MQNTSRLRRMALFLLPAVVLLLRSATAAQPVIHGIRASGDTVGLYEKIELRVSLDAAFDNPFDPGQVDLTAEFTAPSGKVWRVPGFYNPSSWDVLWMVRFAPAGETGEWSYVLRLADSQGATASEPHTFTVTDPKGHGWIRIAGNGRYLQHTDGAPFYGVGLWYNDEYDGPGRGGSITETDLDHLKRTGCNFIGFFPTPLETMATGAGRFDQDRCARLDRIFEWSEAREIKISWNLLFHSYASETVWGGGNARWLTNPYHNVCPAADFFSSPEAWQFQERLFRYIIARWGYSPSLFLWFVVDEIDGTEAWAKGNTEAAEAWCVKVRDWFHANDPWGRPTAGTQSGGKDRYWPGGYGIFDIASREIYEAQHWPMPRTAARLTGKEEHPLRSSYLNYGGEASRLWREFAKPAIIGECGWAHTFYEPSQPGYMAMYHNALWAGLANGLCATPFWWAYSEMLNDNVVNSQLGAFSRFVCGLDFSGDNPGPVVCRVGKGTDAWAMRNGATVFGWAVNPRLGEGIAGEKITLEGLTDGNYNLKIFHTWRGRFIEEKTIQAAGGKITFSAPELVTNRDRANQLGDDLAFVLTPIK